MIPKQLRLRRFPIHIRKDIERALERLEQLGIIEKADGPISWVSPIIDVPKKNGEVRICVDMREANQAILREKHPMPTIDELIADLNDFTIFSTLNLTNAYHQHELDTESRYITTFSTHIGLHRYKRLMFGVNAASEIFQNAISQLLHDLNVCKNFSDDIIVHGKDQSEHDANLDAEYDANLGAEHDANLDAVLRRLQEHGLRLNKAKCKFAQDHITFYGNIFGRDGLAADPKKIEALVNATSPRNVSEVKSLLGMAQYV